MKLSEARETLRILSNYDVNSSYIIVENMYKLDGRILDYFHFLNHGEFDGVIRCLQRDRKHGEYSYIKYLYNGDEPAALELRVYWEWNNITIIEIEYSSEEFSYCCNRNVMTGRELYF